MAEPEDSSEAAAPQTASGSSYALFRNRDFRLYLIGRFVASFGQQMLAMAIGWELFDRTHSALALGLVGLTQIVPMFAFTLPAGHVADNYSRKKVIVISTLCIMFMSVALAVVSAMRWPVNLMYVFLFIGGTARTFLWAASAAFFPSLVDRKDFSKAANWGATTFQLSSIAGPAAGGAIIALAKHHAFPVYAINALAALTFCILVSQVRRHHVVAAKEPMTFTALLTGFNFVFANKIILGIITLDMFAVLLGGATALLPVYAREILHVGPTGLGLLEAALPAGAVLCAFIVAHRPPMQKAGRSLLWAVAAFGVATIAFGFSQWFWLSFLMLFTCGAVDNISVVVRHTLVQLLTPDDKRGRVSAVNNLFIGTSNELGSFESGFVAQLFGPMIGNTLAVGAVISVVSGGIGTILVVGAVAWLWPEIRKYGRLDA